MQRILGSGVILIALASAGAAATPDSAATLLPACRQYLESDDQDQRLRLERGFCDGTAGTVLRLHRELRAAYRFCPPQQVNLKAAIEVLVGFADQRKDLRVPLHALALEAFQERWPCRPFDSP
jgi:hypothetical protein